MPNHTHTCSPNSVCVCVCACVLKLHQAICVKHVHSRIKSAIKTMQLWLIWWCFKSTNSLKMFTTKWAVSHEQCICSRTYSADTRLSWIEMVAMLTRGNQGVSVAVDCLSFYSSLCTFLLRQHTYIVSKPSHLSGREVIFATEIWVSKWCWQHLIASHTSLLQSCNHSSECTLLHNMHVYCSLWCACGVSGEKDGNYVQVSGCLGWM